MSAQPEKALPSATEATSTTRPDNFTFDKYSGRSKAVSEVSIRGYTSDDLNWRAEGNKRLNCGSAANVTNFCNPWMGDKSYHRTKLRNMITRDPQRISLFVRIV